MFSHVKNEHKDSDMLWILQKVSLMQVLLTFVLFTERKCVFRTFWKCVMALDLSVSSWTGLPAPWVTLRVASVLWSLQNGEALALRNHTWKPVGLYLFSDQVPAECLLCMSRWEQKEIRSCPYPGRLQPTWKQTRNDYDTNIVYSQRQYNRGPSKPLTVFLCK
jgi:hypothetical protein